MKIEIIFRFLRRPIQLVVFDAEGLASFLRHLLHVLLGVEVSSVTYRKGTTNWMERRWNLKIDVIPILILTEIFPSAPETWYLKTLIA